METKTKISKGFQTVVPAKIRKKYELQPGDSLKWIEEGGKIKVQPRKRKMLEDVIGIIAVDADAVALKRKVQRGEL